MPTTVERSPQPSNKREDLITPKDAYTWFWPNLNAGGCALISPTLTLSSDGSGVFQGQLDSIDQGNVWEVLGLTLIDSHNLQLFQIPQFDSTPSPGGNATTTFSATVYFPGYMYAYIATINMTYHC